MRPTIRNIHKFITKQEDNEFQLDDDDMSAMTFLWDCENDQVDKLASEEFSYSLQDKKKNLMWVEELKKESGWKEGEYVYANLKTNGDGYYNIFYKRSKENFHWYNFILDKKGFVNMQYFNNYCWEMLTDWLMLTDADEDEDIHRNGFIRVCSIYNDMNIDKILKKN